MNRRDHEEKDCICLSTFVCPQRANGGGSGQGNSSKSKQGFNKNRLSNIDSEHGIYISQCMGIDKATNAPSACNPSKASKLWVSNLPADQKMGAKPGKGKLTLKVDKYFKDGDCIHTKCIIYVTNDHNATDKTTTQAIAFKFGGINLF